MSSILRALKKLDEESMSREGEQGEQKIKMRRIVSRRTGSPRLINRLISTLTVVLLLVVTAWIFINSNRRPPMTEKRENSSKKPVLTQLPPEAPPLKTELKKEPPRESQPVVTAPQVTAEPPQPVIGPKPGFPERGERTATDKTLATAHKTEDNKQLIKKTKHPGFVLSGVLWSQKPGRRVALINDRYLKEGETINGVLVVKIGKDAVTLRSGEETWTLRVKKK